MKLMIAILFTTAVIFGGRGIKRLWHRWRMRRNDRCRKKLEKKLDEAYKRKFAEEMAEVNRWREEHESAAEKHQNIICKNPAYAAAWK